MKQWFLVVAASCVDVYIAKSVKQWLLKKGTFFHSRTKMFKVHTFAMLLEQSWPIKISFLSHLPKFLLVYSL